MRKLFLFIGAVLLSAMMQATVVTKNIPLTGTIAYGTATVSSGTITEAAAWSGAELWEWTEGALEYDHVVLEVSDHNYPILLKVTYAGDPDDISEQIEMPAANNSIAIDIKHAIIKGIAVLNWSENNGVDITITGLYMRGAIGERKEVTLWNTGQTFDEWNAWEDRIVLGASLFEDLHAGDVLEINYTLDEQSYHQLKMHLDWAGETALAFLANVIDEYKQININTTTNPTQMRFPIISETDVANIKTQGGLAIHGKYITVNSIKLIRHDVLWSGTQAVGDFSGGQSIAWSKLADLKVGNILCVRVIAGEYVEAAYNQVFCSYKSDWSGAFSPSVNYLFQEGDEMPMIVEIPVTYKMLKQLKGEQLNIGGKNFTMTDIFIKEGTPTTTVAEYLNVSAAGMATLVVPFDVPTLPAGVEAYELTNSGDETIWANQVSTLEADKPVLIVAAEGEYEFVSEEGASDDISAKTGTYANGALIGTYQAIDPLAETTGANYNYVLNNGTDGVAFYQVLDDGCSVAPYRAYLSCGHNANAGGPGMAPKKSMRIVFHQDTTTGVDNANANVNAVKVLRDGQIYIIRNGVEYNVNGQIVK